jgi:hypothetical protein
MIQEDADEFSYEEGPITLMVADSLARATEMCLQYIDDYWDKDKKDYVEMTISEIEMNAMYDLDSIVYVPIWEVKGKRVDK